jgi:shikimate dehydrogenase
MWFEMMRAGLIGRNITESRSPWLHEQEAEAQGLALSYDLFDFTERGFDDAALGGVLRGLQADGYAGVNVTYPFKQAVMPLLDELGESARLVGAVNTVAMRDGRLVGHNTDLPGFQGSLLAGLAGEPPGCALQIGAGGAGAAVAMALLASGVASLAIFDSDPVRAEALAAKVADANPGVPVAALAALPTVGGDYHGIVNATPVGMAAHPGMPVDPALIEPCQWIADIVYFPLETELLRIARAKGCRTIDGSGMVVGQAALAFEIITGRPADASRMRASFQEA